MIYKVRSYVEQFHMFEAGDKVVVGVSGGADSMALLSLLMKLRPLFSLSLIVVHVNHGLRGEAADEDEAYVRELCKAHDLPFFPFHVDMPGYAGEKGLSPEEAGRVLRRECFLQVFSEQKADKIALAHHKDDNAETMLFHLFRGTGILGMAGIAPVNGIWVHPLLCVNREEIEEYLKEEEIGYRIDQTNAENMYARNRIRNVLLPEAKKVNSQAAGHLSEAAEGLRELWEYIYPDILAWTKASLTDGVLIKEEFEGVPDPLKNYVLMEILAQTCERKKDLQAVHVQALRALLNKQVGRRIDLPYGLVACRTYEGVRFYTCEQLERTQNEQAGDTGVPGSRFSCRIFDRVEEDITFPQNTYTKWFDYDIISNTVEMRHRMPGDYLTIDAAGHTQKLKQYLVNEKIPAEERDSLFVVADGAHIMWVVGYRQNQYYQITKQTTHILEITFHGGIEDGRNSKCNDQ